MTIWLMRVACWILKATDTHLEYVILMAFSLRKLLHQQAAILRYIHFASLVYTIINCYLKCFTSVRLPMILAGPFKSD